MKPLYDLQQEINRLYIAGSKFAKGDPRLARHVPILYKLGEKAPVFKKLAQDVEELIRTDPVDSADKLLGLGTLLYSVLYTQGAAAEEAEATALTPSVSLADISTRASYLELSPMIRALTTSYSGRMNIVEDGFKNGVFNDFRTFEYVNRALGDKYAELADFIERTVIPPLGDRMLPLLLSTFSYEGRAEDIRRFRLLYALKYPGLPEMITKILESSSPALQAEAVKALGDDAANQPLVMTLATDRHKPVREAACQALARYNTPESEATLVDVFLKNRNKSNLEGIVEAIKLLPGFSPEVFDRVRADFETCAALNKDVDEKTLKASFEFLRTELTALYGKTDERILRFFEELLAHKSFNAMINFRKTILEYSGRMIGWDIARNLATLGKPGIETFKRLVAGDAVMKAWGTDIIPNYFAACAKIYSSAQMYDTFIEHCRNKRIEPQAILSTYAEGGYYGNNYFNCQNFDAGKLDRRWVEYFLSVKDDAAFFMAANIEPKNRKMQTMLGDRLDTAARNRKIPDEFLFIIEKADEAEVPNFQDRVLKVFENGKNLTQYYLTYYLYNKLKESPVLKRFPKSFEPRFRMLAQLSKLDVFNEMAEIVRNN
ncbi:MAG: HEAT repeat domain-containing protein [Bacteroidales bacterium]|jgi:hypothetical protein|nr:HEAT repeat domain-containing protein [Bacteroidales bacterium]